MRDRETSRVLLWTYAEKPHSLCQTCRPTAPHMVAAFAVIWGEMLAKDMKRCLWYCCCPRSTSIRQAWHVGTMIAFVCSGLSGPLKDREGITGLQPLIVYQDYGAFQTRADHHQKARLCHSLTHLKDGWYLRKLMAVWIRVCCVLNDFAFWGFMGHVVCSLTDCISE